MKTLFRPSHSRMHRKDDWKESWYAFVPYQTNFGELCGFADDIVAAGKGFGMHPHQDMEISTILLDGAQKHKDNTGSESLIDALSVQTMSAGTGIMHSEYNASETESFHSYQIWVYPNRSGLKPRHEKFSYKLEDKENQMLLALSPDKRNGSALINQDAFFSVARIKDGNSVDYQMNMKGNGVYIHCAKGQISIEGFDLSAGDALGLYETENISILAKEEAELILVEVPMKRGVKI
jgi:quercetin 2,3-dioxygenase